MQSRHALAKHARNSRLITDNFAILHASPNTLYNKVASMVNVLIFQANYGEVVFQKTVECFDENCA